MKADRGLGLPSRTANTTNGWHGKFIELRPSNGETRYITMLSASPAQPIPSLAPFPRSRTWAYNTQGLYHQAQDNQEVTILENSVTGLHPPQARDQPTCYAEQRVKYICHVVGSIGYASVIGILSTHVIMSKIYPRSTGRPGETNLS